MNIYDKANELATAIRESKEVEDVATAMNLVAADPEGQKMLDDFRNRQNELQQAMMSGNMPSQEEMETMEKRFEVLSMNLNIRRLFEAERRLSVVIQDINKLITDSLQHLYGPQM